jgi:hypothetical protein
MDAAANWKKQEEMQTRARAGGIMGEQAYQTIIGLVAACERHASGDLGPAMLPWTSCFGRVETANASRRRRQTTDFLA